MAELQLIGAPQSNFVWVCRIACAEKGVPYTLEPARPHTPEIEPIHPVGKIPAMRHGALARTGLLVGDCFTLAEIDLLPVLDYPAKLPESSAMSDKAKSLKAYFDRHMARPSVTETTPPPMPGR